MSHELRLTENDRAILGSFFEETRRLSLLAVERAMAVLPVFNIARDGRITGIVGSALQVTSF